MDKQISNTDSDCGFGLNLSFPDEFPYEFASPVSSGESPSSDDERLEKIWTPVGSPQSTLAGIWSWSGRSTVSSPNYPSTGSSPPTTPFGDSDDTLKLIYAAAGQVALMKMYSDIPVRRHSSTPGSNHSGTEFYSNKNLTHYNHPQTNQMKMKLAWQLSCSSPLGLPQSAWPSLKGQGQIEQQQCVGSASVIRRESTGTGVFIPRLQSSASDYNRRRVRSGKIGEKVNSKNVEVQYGCLSDELEARRSGVWAQEKGGVENEVCLPQEWTY